VSSGFQNFAAVASGIVSIASLLFIIALLPLVWSLRQAAMKLVDVLEHLRTDTRPLLSRTEAIADDVKEITAVVRREVETVGDTVEMANDRLVDAIDRAERRVRDFDALLGVAQDEVEGVFVKTASAIRGVRRGVNVFRVLFGGRSRRRDGRVPIRGRRRPIDEDFDEAPPPPAEARPRTRPRRDGSPSA
jgi:uncharacterized protein YoxC